MQNQIHSDTNVSLFGLSWQLFKYEKQIAFNVYQIKFLAIFDLFFAKESVNKTFGDTILALNSHLRGNFVEKCLESQYQNDRNK